MAVCNQILQRSEEYCPRLDAIAGDIEWSPEAVGAASLPFSPRFMMKQHHRRNASRRGTARGQSNTNSMTA
jgi:hypothetical protein